MIAYKKYHKFANYTHIEKFNGYPIDNYWYIIESYLDRVFKGLKNYKLLFNYFDYSHLSKDHYLYSLDVENKKQCAFCLKEEPEVTFNTRPHVIPELLGNKFLLHYDECDDCNKWFGQNLEAKLGFFTQPFRMLNRTKNKKKKLVTYQSTTNPKCQFKFLENESIFSIVTKNDMIFNEEKKEFIYNFKIADYVPLDVYKAFMKIFYGLLPRENRKDFNNLRKWIIDKNNNPLPIKPLTGLMTFLPDFRKKPLTIFIFRDDKSLTAEECVASGQKSANFNYISLIALGNLVFEFPLVCDEDLEKIKKGIQLTFNRLPNPYQIEQAKIIDFSSNTKEPLTLPVVFGYEQKIPIDSLTNTPLSDLPINIPKAIKNLNLT